jgi:nitric oxide reductase NorD protein
VPGLAPNASLIASALEERLDELLDAVLSSRRTATAIARELAQLTRAQQDFVLHWTSVITRTNPEMAYQFAARAHEALAVMDLAAVESWVIRAMDTYDHHGLYRGSAILKGVNAFVAEGHGKPDGIAFEEIAHSLTLFLRGLSGRALKVDTAGEIFTDTETVFLPAVMAVFADRTLNQLAYRAACAHVWAQNRFGTFRRDLTEATNAYPDPCNALRALAYIEAVRLDAFIDRDLPGLSRDMGPIRSTERRLTASQRDLLTSPSASIDDSLDILREFDLAEPVALPCYAAVLVPEQAGRVMHARIEREKAALRAALGEFLSRARPLGSETAPDEHPVQRFSIDMKSEDLSGQISLQLDGRALPPSEGFDQLLQSVAQDLGEIPDDYLVPAGDGAYDLREAHPNAATEVWKGTYHEQGAFLYDEWDHRRQHYRKDWCVLREVDVHPGDPHFVADVLARHQPAVSRLKRTFELLRGEEKLLKRQKNGDEIDLDALVLAHTERHRGIEFPEALLMRRQRAERSTAVMFMVDMSGSTKGWINDAEREALVLLCEALEILGDRYAIYGFSGMTRKRCEIYRVKRFSDPYGDLVQRRLAGIQPQDYTRMGVAVRHLTQVLEREDARSKLLVTLSDGKPDDYSDNYRGEYGIEDTRQALFEAHRHGIHPFCITIDKESRDYLPHMYGAANYAVVSEVSALPLKVAEIYRRLTT